MSPYCAAPSSFQHPSIFVLHQDAICSSSLFSSHPAFPYFISLIIFSFLLFSLGHPGHPLSLARTCPSPVPDAASPPSCMFARATRSSGSHTSHRAHRPPSPGSPFTTPRHTGRQTTEVRSGFLHCPDLPSCVDVPCSPSAVVWLLQHPRYFCTL